MVADNDQLAIQALVKVSVLIVVIIKLATTGDGLISFSDRILFSLSLSLSRCTAGRTAFGNYLGFACWLLVTLPIHA